MLSINPPPDSTPYIQAIDDNLGRLFRRDILEHVNGRIEEKGANYKWPLVEKRRVTVEGTRLAVIEWRTDPAKLKLLSGAITRTGLNYAVSGLIPADRTNGNVDPGLLASGQPIRV